MIPSPMSLPKPVMRTIGLLSAALALSAAGMGVACTIFPPHAVWVVFGFELIMCLAGVVGLLFARGQFQEGQGMTLLCVGGTVLFAGFLSFLSTYGPGGIVFRTNAAATSMTPWFVSRIALGLCFLSFAAYAVLRRNPKSRAYIVRGLVASVVLALVVGGMYVGRNALNSMPGAVRGVIFAIGALVAVIGVAAAGHCFIRAFECGRPEQLPGTATPGA